MRCGDCKYWTPTVCDLLDADFEPYIIETGKCSNKKIFYMANNDGADYPPEKDALSYLDEERYSVDLYVGEHFGCIHFERKP